jgi:glycosyltransferase involved in cell wall biosynthesis
MDKSFSPAVSAPPLVSAVIPTHGRPLLVERARRSALDQTLREIEVIVVIDGPDAATFQRLARISDDRVRVLSLDQNVGGSEARNLGVRHARARWVAFLDDDDEWLPAKLERQLEVGESLDGCGTIVASQLVERTETAERILPLRLPSTGEPIGDYLFVRKGWSSGEGFLQTSTWFVSRDLLIAVPFTRGLKRCQDLDWLLHAAALPDTKLAVVPEVLAVFHHDEHGVRVSRTPDWRFIYEWASRNRKHLSRDAFSFVIATLCAPSAAKQRAGARIFLFLLWECLPCGYLTPKCFLLFMICWFLPEDARRNLRAWTSRAGAGVPSRETSPIPASPPERLA